MADVSVVLVGGQKTHPAQTFYFFESLVTRYSNLLSFTSPSVAQFVSARLFH